jgi:molybdopterin-guanine dinucleotide biosynthesis protein A
VRWAAVILAGGTAVRLDGADKASLEYDGRSLLEHALTAVEGAAETVVVGPEVLTTRPVTFTREDPVDGGPLAALCAGVRRLAAVPDLVLAVAVDMPHVTADTVRRLLEAADGHDAAWLVDGDGRRALALAVAPRHLLAIDEPHGLPMRSLGAVMSVVDVPAAGREADDVDSWDDVARLREAAT